LFGQFGLHPTSSIGQAMTTGKVLLLLVTWKRDKWRRRGVAAEVVTLDWWNFDHGDISRLIAVTHVESRVMSESNMKEEKRAVTLKQR
jgi:hypothetical protein